LDADHRRMAQQPVIAPFRQYAVSWKSYRVDRESALIVPAVSVSHAVSAAAYGWYHKSQQTWPRFGGAFCGLLEQPRLMTAGRSSRMSN
jgi:hypothetical protein